LADALELADEERAAFLEAARCVARDSRTPLLNAPNLPTSGLYQLPAAPTPLLGRADDLAQLVQLVRQTSDRLITLVGPPGVGKSRLALAAAEALHSHFTHGVAFVELAALDDPADVAPLIASRLGVYSDDAEAAVAEYIKNRMLLLVLDNFEHLPCAAPLVARLLTAGSQLVVLVTSRTPLRLRAETRFPVTPLALPGATRVAAVATAPATRLFCERASAVAPTFALTVANAQHVTALCRRLDGLPLAIELAAARSDQLTPEALLASLHVALDTSNGSFADLPAHQRTLHAAIAWSERLLAPQARDSFARLGVFRGSFNITAAAAVGATHLDTLVEASMLQVVDIDRFRLLETLRAYAAKRLSAHPDATEVHARHARHYASGVETVGQLLDTSVAGAVMAQLDADFPDLRAVIQWSPTGDGGVAAARIIAALRVYWLSRGAVREVGLIESLLNPDAVHAIPPALLARTLLTVGYVASQRGESNAPAHIERGLTLARRHGTAADVALGLILQGMLCRFPGNMDHCVAILTEAMNIARELDSPVLLAYAVNQLGCMYSVQGQFRQALPLLEEAVRLAQCANEQIMVHRYRCDLGEALRAMGDHSQARRIFEALLKELGHAGDATATWEAHLRLATLNLAEGDLHAARHGLDAAARIVQEMGIRYGHIIVLCRRGYLALAQGDGDGARAALTTAYEASVTAYSVEDMAIALAGLARLALDDDPVRAARLCGVSEGITARFALREDRQARRMRDVVRAKLRETEHELADAASQMVIERIPKVSFPTALLARDTLRLDRVVAAALRG
jgi:predicted ATPase